MSLINFAACSYEGSLFGWSVKDVAPVTTSLLKINSNELDAGYNSDEQDDEIHGKDDEEVDDDNDSPCLHAHMLYGFHCSVGSLKTIAVSKSGRYLVTGGMNERINIFNVAENKSLGELSTHTGAVRCLEFFQDSYLLSGSEDNSICIWRVYDWNCVHILGGHKDHITGMSIHPSGMMALSVSKDNTMKLWNLVQGRCAFTRRLKGPADSVKWHSSGNYYMLVMPNEVQLYLATDNSCVADIKFTSRVNQAVFSVISDTCDRIVAICDDKSIRYHDFTGKSISSVELKGLGGRLRDMSSSTSDVSVLTNVIIKGEMVKEGDLVVVVTSTGRVALFSSNSLNNGESMESSILVATQIRVEPRLTAVVSWNNSSASKETKATIDIVNQVLDSKNKDNTIDSNNNSNSSNSNSNSNSGSKKKNSKKKQVRILDDNNSKDDKILKKSKK